MLNDIQFIQEKVRHALIYLKFSVIFETTAIIYNSIKFKLYCSNCCFYLNFERYLLILYKKREFRSLDKGRIYWKLFHYILSIFEP